MHNFPNQFIGGCFYKTFNFFLRNKAYAGNPYIALGNIGFTAITI